MSQKGLNIAVIALKFAVTQCHRHLKTDQRVLSMCATSTTLNVPNRVVIS